MVTIYNLGQEFKVCMLAGKFAPVYRPHLNFTIFDEILNLIFI